MPFLTINQRNIYMHFLTHQEKNPTEPCYVPPNPLQASRLSDHLAALRRLEELKLIVVDRGSAFYYTGWVMRSPDEALNEHSQEQIHSVRDLPSQSERQQQCIA